MKKLKYIVLIAFAAVVSSCDTDDDGFYNNVFVDVPNLVTMDAHSTTYTVGEKLFLNVDFPTIVNDGALLDVFQTTGASQFAFTYLIEKQVGSDWQVVSVNDSQLDIQKGSAQNGSYVYGICQRNDVSQHYEYRVGFPLLSAGTYRLSYGYNSDSLNTVELRSLSPSGRVILYINSAVSGVDANGYYNFTVN